MNQPDSGSSNSCNSAQVGSTNGRHLEGVKQASVSGEEQLEDRVGNRCLLARGFGEVGLVRQDSDGEVGASRSIRQVSGGEESAAAVALDAEG